MANLNFIPAPYHNVDGYDNIYANNIVLNNNTKKYVVWKYVMDYATEFPIMEIIPDKYHRKNKLLLFHYIRVRHLINNLQNNQLVFSNLSSWNDPFESLFYEDKGITIGDKTYYVGCICFTYDRIEGEESSWNRSGATGVSQTNSCYLGKSVRMELDFEKLCRELCKIQEGYSFYFSVVDYSQSRKDLIKEFNKKKKIKHKKYNSIGEYLNYLSLKRKAFSYENEVRLFIVSDKSLFNGNDFFTINKFDLSSTTTTITLPPLTPQKGLKGKNYSTKQNRENSVIVSAINKVTTANINMNQCRLYDINN